MLADHLFIWCNVDAIDFVVSHVAFEPLYFRPELSQHSARCLRDCFQFLLGQFACIRYFPFDHVLRHAWTLRGWIAASITANSDSSISHGHDPDPDRLSVRSAFPVTSGHPVVEIFANYRGHRGSGGKMRY